MSERWRIVADIDPDLEGYPGYRPYRVKWGNVTLAAGLSKDIALKLAEYPQLLAVCDAAEILNKACDRADGIQENEWQDFDEALNALRERRAQLQEEVKDG